MIKLDRPFQLVCIPDYPGLIDDSFDPVVDVRVDLLEPQIRALAPLRDLFSSFGLLGSYLEKHTETGARISLGFRASLLVSSTDRTMVWCYEWDGVAPQWLEVLVDCLEGYHYQVARVRSVEVRDVSRVDRVR